MNREISGEKWHLATGRIPSSSMGTSALTIRVRVEGLKEAAAAFGRLLEAVNEARRVILRFRQPTRAYVAAGSPYGRNRRGKKRWLLERKRAR